jgi:hypothetical protein
LHASQLSLFHPHEQRQMQLVAPLDCDLQRVLEGAGLSFQESFGYDD